MCCFMDAFIPYSATQRPATVGIAAETASPGNKPGVVMKVKVTCWSTLVDSV